MTLEQLRVLAKVVESGSFTRAADVLGSQRSHVSRVIAQLEAELGATLLERTTRTQSITEAGREVYERAVGILGAVDDAVRVVQKSREAPQGHLRVTCDVEFGMGAIAPWIEEYLARYPKTTAEVEYASRDIDLVHEGFDVAVRAGPIPSSQLVARRLGAFEYGLFASPAYVRARGLPATPDDLGKHALVAIAGTGPKTAWALVHASDGTTTKVTCAARLRVNAGAGVREALLADIGIGQLPHVVADDLLAEGRLVRVLPQWRPPSQDLYAVFPSNRYLTPKLRAFVELALERFPRARRRAGARRA